MLSFRSFSGISETASCPVTAEARCVLATAVTVSVCACVCLSVCLSLCVKNLRWFSITMRLEIDVKVELLYPHRDVKGVLTGKQMYPYPAYQHGPASVPPCVHSYADQKWARIQY